MQTQRVNITLPNDLIRDLRTSIPSGGRSKFIAGVIREKLVKKKNLKKEWIKSLRANKKLYEEINRDWAPLDVENWPD